MRRPRVSTEKWAGSLKQSFAPTNAYSELARFEGQDMAISGLIRVMERAARKAGARLRRDFGEIEHLQVSRKGPAGFVSRADQAAERIVYDELSHARPDWGFLLEEAGEIAGVPAKPRWVIDPLDGTSNVLHALPHFAISSAVQEPKPGGGGWGEVVAGLVYQ